MRRRSTVQRREARRDRLLGPFTAKGLHHAYEARAHDSSARDPGRPRGVRRVQILHGRRGRGRRRRSAGGLRRPAPARLQPGLRDRARLRRRRGLEDASHFQCTGGRCQWQGCKSKAECTAAFQVDNVICAKEGGSPVPDCIRTCAAAADCAGQNPSDDASHYACTGGRCEWLGCKSNAECAAAFQDNKFICVRETERPCPAACWRATRPPTARRPAERARRQPLHLHEPSLRVARLRVDGRVQDALSQPEDDLRVGLIIGEKRREFNAKAQRRKGAKGRDRDLTLRLCVFASLR